MSLPTPVTAVFDIGKTNKKFFLFDENYTVVKKQQTKLDQSEDEHGDPCEDLEALEFWMENKIQDAIRDDEVKIKSLNFSTYGASFVHLDKEGNVATPLYNYLKPYSEELFNSFYETYGGKKKLSLQTASPPMGMLNSGFQLYWLKHEKPFAFEEITCSLHFPQYLSYLFTGKKNAELTSIGCHTGLWDFEQNDYHEWLKQEDLLQLLPSICPVSNTDRSNYKGLDIQVGTGIHDSSAALAPYILAMDDPFMLVSTGTWSITFNPFNKDPLTFEELKRDCLCYMNVFGEQVKSARFFLGNEYSKQLQKLKDHFGISGDAEPVELDANLIKKLVKENDPSRKLKLEEAYNSGPYSQNKPGVWEVSTFDSYEEAYHQLMLDLVTIQAESVKLAQGKVDSKKMIITGGFSQNDFYVRLMACFFPGKEIYTSSLPNASALGAALVINQDGIFQQDKEAAKKLLGLRKHSPCKAPEVGEYSWKESVLSSKNF